MQARSRVPRGYIALMSTLVIGFILLGLAVNEGMSGWYARYNVESSQNKEQAGALAEGCADQALAEIIANPGYASYFPLNSTTAQGTCEVTIVTHDTTPSQPAGLVTIKSQGEVQGSFANLEMSVNLNNVHIGAPSDPTYGTLVVYSVMKNDDQGTKGLNDFCVSVPGGTPSSFCGVSSQAVTVFPANYQISVTAQSDYMTTFSGDCDSTGNVTVAAGAVKTCTITNDDIPTTITVVVNVINNNNGTRNANDFQMKIDGNNVAQNIPISVTPGSHTASGPGSDSSYNASSWGYQCASNGAVSLNAGDQKTCIVNYDDVIPPGPACADTVMMLDRTGTFFGAGANDDQELAANALLSLYSSISPSPQVGVGSFGGLDGSHASTTAVGYLTTVYNQPATSAGPKYPNVSGNPNPNQWTNGNNGRTSDGTFATETTNGEQQGYSSFGFSIPYGANVTGIEVVATGKVSAITPQTTGTLYPNGQGSQTAWTNGESTIDETGAPDCSSGDSVIEATSNDRESVNLDLSVVPNGSTITSVAVTAYDRADTAIGGTYRTFVRVAGTNTDAGANLVTSSTSGCTQRNQTIDVADFVKDSATDLEIGVVKTSTNGNTVRVGALRATVTYTPPAISIALKNGGSWSSSKPIFFTTSNATAIPVGNSATDLWGMTWDNTDFNDNIFAVRVQDTAPGITVSLDSVSVKVNYTANLYSLIHIIGTSQSSVGTWQDEAINSAAGELNGQRHDTTKQKVMVFVSDGIPNGPSTSAVNTAAANAKNSGIQIFAMHFGDTSGVGNMRNWVSPSVFPAVPITTASRTGTTATITTSAAHKLAVNQEVQVSGVSNNVFNGTFTVTATTTTTFKYTTGSSGTANGTGGTATPTNLFRAPAPGQMAEIFTSIGYQACPALSAVATPPPTDGTLVVATHVINDDNNGSKVASDFTMTIATSTLQTFLGVEAPGVTKPATPGNYSVTGSSDADYTTSYSVNCSSSLVGTLAAGETRTCTVTYDDKPDPPPPVNLDINLGSWEEVPTH